MNVCVRMLINVVVLNHMYVCLCERLVGLSTSAGSVNVCMGEDDKQVELRFRILSAMCPYHRQKKIEKERED